MDDPRPQLEKGEPFFASHVVSVYGSTPIVRSRRQPNALSYLRVQHHSSVVGHKSVHDL